MEIGLGLPTSVPGTSGRDVLNWAIESEKAGFASLATLDRLVFDSYECLIALAAAAAVTERVRLATTILISPLRTSTALLAKQAASIDRLSGHRLVLRMAVGGRSDDFSAGGVDFTTRGKRFDDQIREMRLIWAGERRGFAGPIGPHPQTAAGPPLILGGHSPRAIARAAAAGDGWISGGGGPGMFCHGADAVRSAWREAARPGSPRLMALVYFALGDDARHVASSYLSGYYGFAPPYANAVVNGAVTNEQEVLGTLRILQDAGCSEAILVPCSAKMPQIELLSGVLADAGWLGLAGSAVRAP